MEMTHNPYKPIDRQDVEEEGSEPDRGSAEGEHCDFCQEPIKDDEEERHVYAGDESRTLCESCAEHYLE
jgi:hypothetical protein